MRALQSNGFAVRRGYHRLQRELKDKPDAVYYLGFTADEILDLDKDEVAELDGYVRGGGRVVITFEPEDPIATRCRRAESLRLQEKAGRFRTEKGARRFQ